MDVQQQFNSRETNISQPLFDLYQNTPNPFKGSTTIGFHLPKAQPITLTITDAIGRVVQTIQGDYPQGYNDIEVKLDQKGVYHYHLRTSDNAKSRKMIVIE